jgi:hypothetical protein
MPTQSRTFWLLICSGMLLGIPACQTTASPAGLLDGHGQIDTGGLAATVSSGEPVANAPQDDAGGSRIDLVSFELPQRPSARQPAADPDGFALPHRVGTSQPLQ